ncbi:MAG: imidazole glycerol phosphate synthase subunit HisH [Burkholderiales bacterium]|nr:imidazole glycerol phosphate synthase subunit HisH [Burkholderiales bacterium]
MSTIAVIDYGMGNLRSVAKALEHVAPGAAVVVTSDAATIAGAQRVVFPGQGAMPDCMRELDARGLRAAVLAAASAKPFLGICIGLQMLFDFSEEGAVRGLGILRGEVKRFPAEAMVLADGTRLKVPHMGWNHVRQECAHPLWDGIDAGSRFYFVHSYFPLVEDAAIVAGSSYYPFRFTCAVARANIFAVQFHPEKSQAAGLALLRNFAGWDGRAPARSVTRAATA